MSEDKLLKELAKCREVVWDMTGQKPSQEWSEAMSDPFSVSEYIKTSVQHLIDQARAEQREECLKAALSQCNTKRFFDRDYLVECGDIRHAILTATEDK